MRTPSTARLVPRTPLDVLPLAARIMPALKYVHACAPPAQHACCHTDPPDHHVPRLHGIYRKPPFHRTIDRPHGSMDRRKKLETRSVARLLRDDGPATARPPPHCQCWCQRRGGSSHGRRTTRQRASGACNFDVGGQGGARSSNSSRHIGRPWQCGDLGDRAFRARGHGRRQRLPGPVR